MSAEPKPPTIVRRSRHRDLFYGCDECCRIDVPALVEFNYSLPGDGTDVWHGTHSVCKACLEKAVAMFSDPALVRTRTPLGAEERDARVFATMMHGNQKYDSGTEPYVVHLAEVRDVLVEFDWHEPELLVSAWLHDVVEDTHLVVGHIGFEFGKIVEDLVWAVTGRGENRAERNEDAYKKMTSHPGAIPLKLADRLANARASKQTSRVLFEMYKREHPAFKARLEPASATSDPRVALMWRALDEIFA
jgi:hypothetical protein